MNIYELTTRYWGSMNDPKMANAVKVISEFVEKNVSEEEGWKLMRSIYAAINGYHYSQEFAEERIQSIYYIDKEGNYQYGPYWAHDKVERIFDGVMQSVPEAYNVYDFEVTMTMIMSDYGELLSSWFKNNMEDKVVEMAVSYLNDPDSDGGKIWRKYES